MRPAPATYGPNEDGAATRQILERAMGEAKRIRLDALATAEQSHRALTEATRIKCDEMLAAAHEEAAAIVDGARREAQRLRAQAAMEAPIPLTKGNQTSAHMVLEMAFEEAEQMVAKAAEDAERLRESLIADARASAMEIIRAAEIESADRMREARQRLEILREQTKQIYERLCNVTGDMADRQANADELRRTPSPEAEMAAALRAEPDEAEVVLEAAQEVASEDLEPAVLEAETDLSEDDDSEDAGAPAETLDEIPLSNTEEVEEPSDHEAVAEPAGVEEANDPVSESTAGADDGTVAYAEADTATEAPAFDQAPAMAVATSLARWKPDHSVALTRYVPAAYVWQTSGPATTAVTPHQPVETGSSQVEPSPSPVYAAEETYQYEEAVSEAPAAFVSRAEPAYEVAAPGVDGEDAQPQPIGLLAQRLGALCDEGEKSRSDSTERIFGLQARLRDSLGSNGGESGGFRRFLSRQNNS